MSRGDEDLKEMIWLLQSLLDHAQYGMRVKTYDDCNNCKRSKCKYMPEPGQMVRINCPLWSNKDEEDTPEIVHCRDCKHSYQGNYFRNYACRLFGDDDQGLPNLIESGDFFCGYGEKREKQ